jgi:hypothetical protein
MVRFPKVIYQAGSTALLLTAYSQSGNGQGAKVFSRNTLSNPIVPPRDWQLGESSFSLNT